MRTAPLAFLLAASLGTLPAQSAGQARDDGPARAGVQQCEIQSASSSTRGTTLPDQGRTFMGGGVFFECAGGTTIRSDSLAHFETAGMVEFFGNVHYADTVKTLSAGYVRYIDRIGQVIAQDSVVLSDIESGSQIRSPYLEYFQATEIRPEAFVRIPSGRPRAILVSRPGDSARAVSNLEPPDSTFIDADAMDFYGERLAVARGNVVVLREDMQAFGEEAHFDQLADSMLMTGAARVVTDERQVHGDTIAALVTPDHELRQVNAWRNARLESEDLEAEAPGLRILFEDGEVYRMIALGERTGARTEGPDPVGTDETAQREAMTDSAGAAQPEAEESAIPDSRLANTTLPMPPRLVAERDGAQARITSNDVRMVGDSIDALAPGQQIERVIAVGAAFGERLTTDSTVVRPAVAAHDWMSGDTIIATFAPAPDTADGAVAITASDTGAAAAAADTAAAVMAVADTAGSGAEHVLETLTAIGDSTMDARSLYAVANEEDPLAPPALSYMVARRIHVTLRDGEVFDVNAVGSDGMPVRGLYLEPSDSTAAQTVSRSERDP